MSLRRPAHAAAEAEHGEASERLNAALPPELRSSYLKMLAGQKVGKADRDRVRAALVYLLPKQEEEEAGE